MNNAVLSRRGKSLVMASRRKSSKFEDALANIRRLFGSRRGGTRQDALFTEEVLGPLASDEDSDALAAFRQEEKRGAGEKKKDSSPKRGRDKAEGGGQTLNGVNRKTGLRNRRYRCDSEYHLAPGCPWRDIPRGGGSSFPRERDRAHKPSYSSISMETPVSA